MRTAFGGISEGVFAAFIVFSSLVGMLAGAYLMDRERFVRAVSDFARRLYAQVLHKPGEWFRHGSAYPRRRTTRV